MSALPQSASAVDDHDERVHPGAKPKFGMSARHAVHGVRHVFRHERNARIELVVALVVVVVALVLRVAPLQWLMVTFAIMLVFLAEVFNTAIERTLDLIDVKENPHIKVIKDMTAGAVLLAAVTAAVVAAVVFGPVAARWLWGN